jgi:FAD dependent oxidoreductase TIGR03364
MSQLIQHGGVFDVIVIGGGIMGVAIAAVEAERGRRVLLLEREEHPVGASVQNFGLLWCLGQPAHLWKRALRTRARWLEFAPQAGFHASPNGSIHLAHSELEAAVLKEFLERAPEGFQGHWLQADEIPARCTAVRRAGLVGGLWSPHETTVDGREAVPRLLEWLQRERGVEVRFDAAVSRVEAPEVVSAAGTFRGDRIYVCTGAELRILFPDVYRASGITKTKLQMWRTRPQPGGWRLGPSLCAGLTYLHYAAFADCRSLPALRAEYERTHAEHLAHGIHVLLAQNALGEAIVGDTHHYAQTHDPFLHDSLDRLIADYLNTFASVPDPRVAQRWMGVYARIPGKTDLIAHPQPGVTIINAMGGAGMTLSFGLAEELVPE